MYYMKEMMNRFSKVRNVPRWLSAPGLNVRDLLAVADGLDVVRCEGGGGAEQGGHALAQAVAH